MKDRIVYMLILSLNVLREIETCNYFNFLKVCLELIRDHGQKMILLVDVIFTKIASNSFK
uniref:Uncharacterized protein n=1 Tax=Nelumbo nucifera TaxID=4432 RepID=A0A822ZW37_NELNU|nr:TPA_asm: hypothetical protein HUJ06_019034 [Nelumbo nucifera]